MRVYLLLIVHIALGLDLLFPECCLLLLHNAVSYACLLPRLAVCRRTAAAACCCLLYIYARAVRLLFCCICFYCSCCCRRHETSSVVCCCCTKATKNGCARFLMFGVLSTHSTMIHFAPLGSTECRSRLVLCLWHTPPLRACAELQAGVSPPRRNPPCTSKYIPARTECR